MPLTDLFSRIRKARLVRVLVVYLGASWVLLEVADVLTDALALPAWVSPVVVLLLLVGLVIVLATAWVQTHPLVAARAESDEVPEAWELDVRDLGRAVRGGRLPHLTWPRALLGGLVAFSLLFGAAGMYVLWTDGGGPAPLAAEDGAAPGVAVLPFDARGVDDTLWGDGLVDLISTNLDGVGGLRAIDSRTVLARWRQSRASGGDLASSLELARSAGARYAVVGTATGVAEDVRVAARLYDVTDGHQAGAAQVEGHPDSVLTLVDALSVELLRDVLSEEELGVAPRSLARVTTSSVPALRAYLRGEAANRQADFPTAIQAYEEALAADSTFALAAYRLSSAYGWTQSRGSEASSRNRALAARYSERLPQRDAALLQASEAALGDSDPGALATLEELAAIYPDDPDVQNMLGEARYHVGPMVLRPRSEAVEAFERAIALDSAFAPAYIHPVEMVIGAGRDSAAARKWIEAYARIAAVDARLRSLEFAYELAYGDPEALPDETSFNIIGYTIGALDRGDWTRAIPALLRLQSLLIRSGTPPPPDAPAAAADFFQLTVRAEAGRIRSVLDELPTVDPMVQATLIYILTSQFQVQPPSDIVASGLAIDATSQPYHLLDAATAAVHLGRDDVVDRAVELLREAAAGPDSVLLAFAPDAVEAYAEWHRGSPERALNRLQELQQATMDERTEELNEELRYWIGQIHLGAGRIDEAIRYLRSVNHFSMARLLLAEAYEAAGRDVEAAAAYADMARVWEGADPDFEPLQRVRQGLERLRSDA